MRAAKKELQQSHERYTTAHPTPEAVAAIADLKLRQARELIEAHERRIGTVTSDGHFIPDKIHQAPPRNYVEPTAPIEARDPALPSPDKKMCDWSASELAAHKARNQRLYTPRSRGMVSDLWVLDCNRPDPCGSDSDEMDRKFRGY